MIFDRVEGSLGDDVVPANSYSVLYPGFTRAKVALRNMTPKEIVFRGQDLSGQDGHSQCGSAYVSTKDNKGF